MISEKVRIYLAKASRKNNTDESLFTKSIEGIEEI